MATNYLKDKQKLIGIRYMIFTIAAVNVIVSIILYVISTFFENSLPIYLQSLAIEFAAYVIPIMIYAKNTGITVNSAAEKFYLKKSKAVAVVLAAFMGAGFQFLMVVVDLPINILLKNTESYLPQTPVELAAAIVVIGIIPAFFEEFLFRGIVLGSMSEFNTRAAVIFSAVMFAVLHADVCSLAGYILMGIVLASVVRRAGSLLPAVVFHLANNTAALLLGYCNSELVYAPVFTIVLFLAGILVFFLSYTLYTSVTKKPRPFKSVDTGVMLGQSFISYPIILCFFVIVAGNILIRFI